jgi:hypothetical protein
MGGTNSAQLSFADEWLFGQIGPARRDYFEEFVNAPDSYAHSNAKGTTLLMAYIFHAEVLSYDAIATIIDRAPEDYVKRCNQNGATALMYACCRDTCRPEIL